MSDFPQQLISLQLTTGITMPGKFSQAPFDHRILTGTTKLTTIAAFELMPSIIDHKKVFVLALNGPAVGGGAAWFEGLADICVASEDT